MKNDYGQMLLMFSRLSCSIDSRNSPSKMYVRMKGSDKTIMFEFSSDGGALIDAGVIEGDRRT